jgi:hypothetical protein
MDHLSALRKAKGKGEREGMNIREFFGGEWR